MEGRHGGGTRVQARGSRVKAKKMEVFLALNRTTSRRSGATLRRSREESSQRRDVLESGKNQRHDVDIQRRDVPERGLIQRHDVEISRRDVPDRGLIQRHDVEIQRRDVTEKSQNDVTTLRRRDVATSRC